MQPGPGAIIATSNGVWCSCGGLKVRNSQAITNRSGAQSWALDRAEFGAPNGATAPFPLTAVFEQGAEGRRLMPAHFSPGVPDAEVFDESPA